jgi:hypothetical protein
MLKDMMLRNAMEIIEKYMDKNQDNFYITYSDGKWKAIIHDCDDFYTDIDAQGDTSAEAILNLITKLEASE